MFSYIIRREHVRPHKIIRGHTYNVVLTTHALVIIFFIVIPVLIGGFGNYFLPIILGYPDLLLPRLNLLRFWLLPGAFIFLIIGISLEGGSGTG